MCYYTGNIRANVSGSNDLLAHNTLVTIVQSRPILCQIVRFKSGFMTRRRAQNGAIPTFTDIDLATWDGHQETQLLYPPHVLLTVNFTLSIALRVLLY